MVRYASLVFALALSSCVSSNSALPQNIPNTLTGLEAEAGWELLWDGETTNGWRSAKAENFPARGWEIKDGVLSVLSSGGAESRNGGDIITTREYSSFELQVDFRITTGPTAVSSTSSILTCSRVRGRRLDLSFRSSTTMFTRMPEWVRLVIAPWGRFMTWFLR